MSARPRPVSTAPPQLKPKQAVPATSKGATGAERLHAILDIGKQLRISQSERHVRGGGAFVGCAGYQDSLAMRDEAMQALADALLHSETDTLEDDETRSLARKIDAALNNGAPLPVVSNATEPSSFTLRLTQPNVGSGAPYLDSTAGLDMRKAGGFMQLPDVFHVGDSAIYLWGQINPVMMMKLIVYANAMRFHAAGKASQDRFAPSLGTSEGEAVIKRGGYPIPYTSKKGNEFDVEAQRSLHPLALGTMDPSRRERPLDLFIMSPGGTLLSALGAYDVLRSTSVPKAGRKYSIDMRLDAISWSLPKDDAEDERKMIGSGRLLRTYALGRAMSAAGLLFLAGDVRVVTPNSFILLHEPSAGAFGAATELEGRLANMNKAGLTAMRLVIQYTNLVSVSAIELPSIAKGPPKSKVSSRIEGAWSTYGYSEKVTSSLKTSIQDGDKNGLEIEQHSRKWFIAEGLPYFANDSTMPYKRMLESTYEGGNEWLLNHVYGETNEFLWMLSVASNQLRRYVYHRSDQVPEECRSAEKFIELAFRKIRKLDPMSIMDMIASRLAKDFTYRLLKWELAWALTTGEKDGFGKLPGIEMCANVEEALVLLWSQAIHKNEIETQTQNEFTKLGGTTSKSARTTSDDHDLHFLLEQDVSGIAPSRQTYKMSKDLFEKYLFYRFKVGAKVTVDKKGQMKTTIEEKQTELTSAHRGMHRCVKALHLHASTTLQKLFERDSYLDGSSCVSLGLAHYLLPDEQDEYTFMTAQMPKVDPLLSYEIPVRSTHIPKEVDVNMSKVGGMA